MDHNDISADCPAGYLKPVSAVRPQMRQKGEKTPMTPQKNTALEMHARAAATLYGIISFDNFFRILKDYYPEDPINKEYIMRYFWTSENNDPTYYIRDELIIHASISSGEIEETWAEIKRNATRDRLIQYRILPQKEFLKYANPAFYEDGDGVRMMKSYLSDDLEISEEDVEEIMVEMAFIVRSDAVPTYIMTALERRGFAYGKKCELALMTTGCEMEPDIRRWTTLGYNGHEVAKLRLS